jgi:hypothetical protein
LKIKEKEMKYITHNISSSEIISAETEITFDIATDRINGAELVCFGVSKPEDEKISKKLVGAVFRLLKKLKGEKKIQFYATDDSFSSNATEAQYLYNKYPEQMDNRVPSDSLVEYIYVKL